MTPTITDPPRYVFVYGTLRRDQLRDINRLHPAPMFIGRGQTRGTLFHLGSYPGIRLGGSEWVQGEVYQITPELECQLDEIEEVWPQRSGEYERRDVPVKCAGTILICLIYEVTEIRAKVSKAIPSGDWEKID